MMKKIIKQRIACCKLCIVFFLLLIAYCQLASAQQLVTLQAAIDTALKNNLALKNEILTAEYQKKLKTAAVDIPQTNLTGEYGQFNSFYKDNTFGISQSISFPTVYAKQKSVQNETYKSSVMNIAIKEAELKKEVSETFYLLIYLQQKQKILLQSDSMFAAFLEKATLRFNKGESNVLEKATAETQRGQIAIQLNQLKTDVEIAQLQFQLLLNTITAYIPQAENPKMPFTATADTSAFNNHPQLKLLQQHTKISLANTQLQKNKLFPELHFGYYNQSIKGNGADNVFYTKAQRFSSVQFGLGVPLFFGSQKAKISSAKTQQLISENTFQIGLQSFKAEYESTFKQYQTQLQAVEYFEDTALPNATTITKTANEQFNNGEINYLEWTMLIHNAAAIQSNYAEAVKEFNQSIIQLNYFTTK